MAKILVSTPDGETIYKSTEEALTMLPGLLNAQEYQWERHYAGEDCEHNLLRFDTFRGAVEAAVPHYREIGLTFEQAALLAMDLCLVVSTGITDE